MFSAALRSSARSLVATRSIHYTTPVAKTVTESVKDAADTLNKKIGQGLASALGTGQNASQAAKETVEPKAEQAKQSAAETAQSAKETIQPKAEQAKQTAYETAEQAKRSASETATQAKQKGNQTAAGARQGAKDFKEEVQK